MQSNIGLKGFIAAFGNQWLTKMSGPPTVPFAIISIFVPQIALKVAFAALAITCGLVASYGVWAKERNEVNVLSNKLRTFEETRPRLRPRFPNPVEVVPVNFWGVQDPTRPVFSAPFVRIRFINDPVFPSPSASVTAVAAKVSFVSDDKLLLEMDGRWSDTDQPSARSSLLSRNDLLTVPFGIGAEHTFDIAFRDPTGEYFAWNNDNYNHADLKKPEHRLIGSRFQVQVRLRGTLVDETSEFEMLEGAEGEIGVTQPAVS